MKEKIIIGMSGGVDSAVASAILKDKGFEVEGLKHDHRWFNNIPLLDINYFITKSIFEKKNIIDTQIDDLLSKKNKILNENKLSKIISYLQIK